MKILVLSYDYYPELGVTTYRTAALIQALLKTQHPQLQIDLITTMPEMQAETPPIEYHEQVKIQRLPVIKRKGRVAQWFSFIEFARQLRARVQYEQYQFIYANSPYFMFASLATWIAKPHSVVIIDIRHLLSDSTQLGLPKWLERCLQPILKKIENWTFMHADHINLVSKGYQSEIKQRFPNQQVTFYPNGIVSDIFLHGFHSINKASEPFTLLYVGHIDEAQSLDGIIPQLAKSLEGCAQIKIMGEGKRKTHLEAAIQEWGCTNVTLLPFQDRETLFQIYAQADVLFYHLKDEECFSKLLPSTIFEYAATGKPILAGVGGFCAQFIRQEIANSAIFSPYDIEHALQKIATLNFDLQERSEFIKKYQLNAIMEKMVKNFMGYL